MPWPQEANAETRSTGRPLRFAYTGTGTDKSYSLIVVVPPAANQNYAEAAKMPTVKITDAIRVACVAGFCLCVASLALWLMAGLFFISPFVSILGCFLAGLFWILTRMVEREWVRNGGGPL